MTGRKSPKSPKGLVPRLKDFWSVLGERYHRILQVVDDALNSDNLKERTWAVDVILKRLPLPEKQERSARKKTPELTASDIQKLDGEALLARIRESLKPLHSEERPETESEPDDVAD